MIVPLPSHTNTMFSDNLNHSRWGQLIILLFNKNLVTHNIA